jgi:D-cysteine desulfhydrase
MSNIFFLEKHGDANIYIKREDLHPFSFGGNKVKIAQELFADMEDRGFSSVISFGSPTSNMNRAVAHMAASKGIPCYVVMKKDPDDHGPFLPDGPVPMNEYLVRMSGAEVIECVPDKVRETIDTVIARSEGKGEKPYYIYGDSTGHGNEEVLMRAYGKQYWPIREYEREQGIDFRHIFLPVGTAATISGLIASISEGYEVEDPGVQVHGISIARSAPAVREAIAAFLSSCGYDTDLCFSIADVTDAYLGGGYGSSSGAPGSCSADRKGHCPEGRRSIGDPETGPVTALILDMMRRHGLPLDPVYTGKAFYGMLREIDRLKIGGDVLFIHTGGLPLYMDHLRSLSAE